MKTLSEVRAIVREVMREVDPEGLLRMGAPDDEYDREILDIARYVSPSPFCEGISFDSRVAWFGAWIDAYWRTKFIPTHSYPWSVDMALRILERLNG